MWSYKYDQPVFINCKNNLVHVFQQREILSIGYLSDNNAGQYFKLKYSVIWMYSIIS